MRRRFPATYGLLTLMVTVHAGVTVTGGSTSLENLVRWGALVASRVEVGEYWRLVTAMFLHGGLLHLGVNAFSLYQLGPIVEHLFGIGRFPLFFVMAGIGGTALSATFSPGTMSVGASGGIFGLAGLLLTMAWTKKEMLSTLFRNALMRGMLPLVVVNLILGFTHSGIDNYGHIGGLVTGGLIGIIASPKRRGWLAQGTSLVIVVTIIAWAALHQMEAGV